MKVNELIEELQKCNPEATIVVEDPYSDEPGRYSGVHAAVTGTFKPTTHHRWSKGSFLEESDPLNHPAGGQPEQDAVAIWLA